MSTRASSKKNVRTKKEASTKTMNIAVGIGAHDALKAEIVRSKSRMTIRELAERYIREGLDQDKKNRAKKRASGKKPAVAKQP
jgi:hypothetical protein